MLNKKHHWIWVLIAVAVLIVAYFAFSCKDCKNKWQARYTKTDKPKPFDAQTDKGDMP